MLNVRVRAKHLLAPIKIGLGAMLQGDMSAKSEVCATCHWNPSVEEPDRWSGTRARPCRWSQASGQTLERTGQPQAPRKTHNRASVAS